MIACSSASNETSDDSSESVQTPAKRHPGVHYVGAPTTNAPKPLAAAGAHLDYGGGKVIPNIKAYTVAWGNSVLDQSTMNSFFTAITTSAYVSWLSEYSTPTQTIGLGSFGGAFVDANPPSGTTISDAQIQAEIKRLLDAGQLPQPDENSYYQILFPPNVTITAFGDTFCKKGPNGTPCAYHDSFVYKGVPVRYSPQPDYSGSCFALCGGGLPNSDAALTTAASHEMTEAITDADPNNAWNDPANGEIGDICEIPSEPQGFQVAGFFVQTEWSNQLNKCITTKDGQPPPPPPPPPGKCSHDICATGGKLVSSCDACVTKICGADSFCCNTSWDATCVKEVGSICGQTCGAPPPPPPPPPGGCSHAICTSGGKLTSGCDPCVTKICNADAFCCKTSWDNICVGEVGSICGQTCN